MKKFVALLFAVCCSAADWTCAGGEQRHEKILSVKSVVNIQLVVKRKLSNEPLGAPVMLGGLVTNKGIKDLVFISGGGAVYAVDSDLGTLFWERHLEGQSAGNPMLEPRSDDNDDDDYLSTDVRQLFLWRPAGKTVTLNAGSGADLATPKQIPSCKSYRVHAAVANGVRFELVNSHAKPVLRALDARDGHELYNSGNRIEAPVDSSGLAIANGHVCFGDTAGTLYCFGFPIDLS
jgi:outer membrane protein assembly factor BamB